MIDILFFIETLTGGGAEKVLRTLVNNMDQSKFQITVVTAWPEDAEKYLVSGIRYHSLYSHKNAVNRLRMRLEAMLGLTYPMHMKGNHDIEVAYLECGSTKILAQSTNKKAVKVAWVHCDLCKMTDDIDGFIKKSAPWYSKYQKVVCVSETVRDSYVKLFGNKPESVILYNSVDDEEITQKASVSVPSDIDKGTLNIITVGRLSKEKGYDRLLRAHKRLIDEGFGHHLWILGDGPEKESLEKFIAENTLEDSVSMPGFQSNPYAYMANSDVVVCSSRYEGFSTVVTEALILGKPVVTTECSGMRELLGDSEYGLIVDNSEEGIYQGLKKFLSSQTLCEEYTVKAKERGAAFRKDILVQKTEDFFIREMGVN